MADRDSKAAAAEFREKFGLDFDEFTRQAPVKLLLGLAKFAEPIDLRVLQFADESHPLFQQQRESLILHYATLGSSKRRVARAAAYRSRSRGGAPGAVHGDALGGAS
jgi:hypothetical protein